MKKKIIALAMLSALLIAGVFAGCGEEAQKTPSNQEPEVSQENSTKESEPVSKSNSADVLKVGSTSTLGDWEIKLDEFEILDSIKSSYGSFNPDEGNQYAVASLTIKNIGKDANEFLPMFIAGDATSAKLIFDGEYEYSASNLLGEDRDLHTKSVNPLASVSGIIAFELPKETASSDKPLTLEIKGGTKKLEFSLR